jgi:hypothetical protein
MALYMKTGMLPFFKLNIALATEEIWHFSKAIC